MRPLGSNVGTQSDMELQRGDMGHAEVTWGLK